MIFDGQRWTRCKTVVPLPRQMWDGVLKNFVRFGKIVGKDADDAIETDYKRGDEKVYVKKIACEGHSLTNLMYAPKGYKYLMLDGIVYVRIR